MFLLAPDDDGIAVLMGGIRRTVIPDAFNRKGAAVRPGDGCRLHIAGGIKNRRNTDIDSFKKTWCGTKSGKIKRVRENGRHNYPDEA